jgi:hypothetical protein
MRKLLGWLLLGLLPMLTLADTVLSSPDGAFKATFIEVPAHAPGMTESLLNVADQGGKIVLSQDYRSESGLHGFTLAKARWTPDSKFLVYTLSSSGGHQPWRFPLYVYSRKLNKVVGLEARLGPVTSPALAIRAPNTLAVQHKDKKTQADRVSVLVLERVIK